MRTSQKGKVDRAKETETCTRTKDENLQEKTETLGLTREKGGSLYHAKTLLSPAISHTSLQLLA